MKSIFRYGIQDKLFDLPVRNYLFKKKRKKGQTWSCLLYAKLDKRLSEIHFFWCLVLYFL